MKPKQKPEKPAPALTKQDPDTCSFCNEGRLSRSASGKNLVCQKCGRIAVKPKKAPAV